ncbi:hypothetical protein niasHT_020315 [Heterodera trifolii]|uniref:Uncharacterized protein n=1 Tax=Heterodera trifolii TaxID=157864 RepID=A0ABD2K426_9BILA
MIVTRTLMGVAEGVDELSTAPPPPPSSSSSHHLHQQHFSVLLLLYLCLCTPSPLSFIDKNRLLAIKFAIKCFNGLLWANRWAKTNIDDDCVGEWVLYVGVKWRKKNNLCKSGKKNANNKEGTKLTRHSSVNMSHVITEEEAMNKKKENANA